MHAHGAAVLTALAKRVAESDTPRDAIQNLPGWAWMLMLLNIVAFLPVFLYSGYTLNMLPIFAMIEDPSPPAYEPVALTDDQGDAENPAAPGGRKPLPPLPPSNAPISASVRNLHRMLLRISGYRSLFRGLLPAFAFAVAFSIVAGCLSAILPSPIASLAAYAITLPLSTAWLHVIISAPTTVSFWHRIPSLRKTFTACAIPLLAIWASTEFANLVPLLLLPAKYRKAAWMGLRDPNTDVPPPAKEDVALMAIAILLQLILVLFVTIPAEAVFRRVQASMLPEEHDTNIPFVRTFSGEVEPVVVGGPGFAHWKIAFKTFDAAAWKRLIFLFVKLMALHFAIFVSLMAVFLPQIWMVYRKLQQEREGH